MFDHTLPLQESEEAHKLRKNKVTILASEWAQYRGGLSTVNRELAIQLAKYLDVEVTFLVPKCSGDDKSAALCHNIKIVEAIHRFGELDWLIVPPAHLEIDIVVAHGVKHGRQAKVIRDSKKCKWIQVVHTVPELVSKGEDKHIEEEELCRRADYVVEVGPNLSKNVHGYFHRCKVQRTVFHLMPGIFDEYKSIKPGLHETNHHRILLCGGNDAEEMELKGFNIAAKAVAEAPGTWLLVTAPHEKQTEIAQLSTRCGVPAGRVKLLSSFMSRERLFSEVDLVIMPSGKEGFGLTALEALSAGVPVLVSRNSGFGKALSSVPFGEFFVLDSEDPKDWAARISSMWNKGRQKRLEEAEILRGVYGKKYQWQKQVKTILDKMTDLYLDESYNETEGEKEQTPTATSKRDADVSANAVESSTQSQVPLSSAHPSQHHTVDEKKSDKKRTLTELWADTLSDSQSSKQCKRGMFPAWEQTEARIQHLADTLSDSQSSEQCKRGMFPAWEQTEARIQHFADELIERIRQLYSRREGRLVPFPWFKDFNFNLKDIYTNLKIVNRERARGILTNEITNMTGIFRPYPECEKPRVVLIEGDPGMGKSVYCQRLAFDWANKQGEWDASFPAIELLLFLRCNNINSDIWAAIEDQILPADINEHAKESFFKYVQQNQSKVLLLLDGLDEADPYTLDMYYSLLQGKHLSCCHFIITCRPEVAKKVRPYCDTLWEIVGFTKQDAESFIRRYFQGKGDLAERLIGQLEADSFSNLGVLTKTPLNVAILCGLCEDLEGVLPTNGTQLYIEIVLCVLRRYEQKNGLSTKGDDLVSVYKRELVNLGRCAFHSLLIGKSFFEKPEAIDKSINFGFLSLQQGRTKSSRIRCAFPHRSFHEFFAGFYLAFQIIDKEIDCASVVADDRYLDELRQVFLFMSGIVAVQSEETAVSLVRCLSVKISHLLLKPDRDVRSYIRLACECISECSVVGERLESRLVSTVGEHLDMSTVNTLTLWNSGIHSAGAAAISHALAANSRLRYLDLSGNSIGDAGTHCLSQVLAVNYFLTHLFLSHNDIGDSGASALFEALAVNVSLNYLNLRNNNVGDFGASSLAQALVTNCSLTSLDLSQNQTGFKGAAALSQALAVNSSLTALNFSCNRIDDIGAGSLAQSLAVNTSLKTLELSQNNIGDVGACSLSEALAVNSSLTSLDLSQNQTGVKGAAALSQALAVNFSLTALNFSCNRIDDVGAKFLAQSLAVNTSLTTLDLSQNNIGDMGACSLSQALASNSFLSDLNLGSNSISDRGAAAISEAIIINSSLSQLDLRNNRIGDDGIAVFIDSLKKNDKISLHY